MAIINDPRVVTFVKERVRVRAESVRAIKAMMEDDMSEWLQVIQPLVPNDAGSTIYDERADVNVLTGADINTILFRWQQLLAILEAANAMDVVNKACVRPLNVTLGQ